MKNFCLERRLKAAVMLIAAVALVFFAFLPTPCPAETRVTVQFVFGGVFVGGVGFFIYFSQSFPVGFQALAPQPAFLTIEGTVPRWGWTLPQVAPIVYPGGGAAPEAGFEMELIQWRF